MIPRPDPTHDPARHAWLDSANAAGTDFPVQNLPFGVMTRDGEEGRLAVAIGERALDCEPRSTRATSPACPTRWSRPVALPVSMP